MKGIAVGMNYVGLGAVHRELSAMKAEAVPQLQSGRFKSLMGRLSGEFEGYADRMIPIELDTGESLIVVLSDYARDDATLAMVIALQQLGLRLATPPLVEVCAAQLSAVTRQCRHEIRSVAALRPGLPTPGHVLFSLLDDMLAWAVEHGASDLHIHAFDTESYADVAFSVRFRLQRPAQFSEIGVELMLELLAVVWMRIEGGNGAIFEPLREQQGRLVRWIAGRPMSLRWASIASHKGPSVTLRILGRDLSPYQQSLEQLGYSPSQLDAFERACLATGGAVILAGTVGSGKSTTLATLIRRLPRDRKIMTLEDPIEFDLPNAIQCAVTSFGEGQEDDSRFDLKLRAIKRSAATDVLIGEVRDQGSARALSDLIIAGTNVYTTVHAGSALQILHRLHSPMLGVSPELIRVPGAIKLLVYQVLLNALCPHCCWTKAQWLTQSTRTSALGHQQSWAQAQSWLERFVQRTGLDDSVLRFRQEQGCEYCRVSRASGRGYDGMLMCAEMLEPQYDRDFQWWLEQTSRGGEPQNFNDDQRSIPYPSCRALARSYVEQGRLDPREFEWRFGEFACKCQRSQ